MSLNKAKPQASLEPDTGLKHNARREIAQRLSWLLSETYLLQLKTQYYHWNVTGPNFSGLHKLFETQYNELAASVDEIAERIRALGAFAPGTFHEFLELSTLKEDKTLPGDWQAMVRNLLNAHETVARDCRSACEEVVEVGDEGSIDLLNRRMLEHEKTAWMLRSHLQ